MNLHLKCGKMLKIIRNQKSKRKQLLWLFDLFRAENGIIGALRLVTIKKKKPQYYTINSMQLPST